MKKLAAIILAGVLTAGAFTTVNAESFQMERIQKEKNILMIIMTIRGLPERMRQTIRGNEERKRERQYCRRI